MSIEVITVDHFSTTTHPETMSEPKSHTRHSVFHYFLSDDIKQDYATTAVHSKFIIELFK